MFKYTLGHLYEYHCQVLIELIHRGYSVDAKWYNRLYRGKNLKPAMLLEVGTYVKFVGDRIYLEHDIHYLDECISNLAAKGVKIDRNRALTKMENHAA